LISSSFSNLGAVILNHNQVSDGSQYGVSGSIFNTLEVKQALKRAIQLRGQNDSAWRTLGYIWLAEKEEGEAIAAWRHVPEMSSEMYAWANRAIDEEDPTTALTWHKRHTALLPEFGDSWYYQGLILVQQGKWSEALSAFEEASQRKSFQTPLLSDSYFQQGSIYQWAMGYRDLDRALLMYDAALQIDMFSAQEVKAETYYKRGEIYGWLGREQTSVAEFQKALDLNPSHKWARLRHGYSRYWIDKELEPAEQEIKDVIAVWEESKSANLIWAYRYLGEIYEDAGQISAAVTAYQNASQLDPTNAYLRDKLAGLN
jgi:tetratricopeptide (TPR) repeat protein